MTTYLTRLTSSADNCVITTQKLLELLQVPVTRSSVEDTILEHPDHPSLLSICDALKAWQVEHKAVKIPATQLNEIDGPFIAQIHKAGQDYFIVVKEVLDRLVFYYDENGKPNREAKDDFIAKLTGIVLLAEATESSSEDDYLSIQRKEQRKKALLQYSVYSIPALSIVACVFAFAHTGWQALLPTIFLVLALSGTFVGVLLQWYELDQYNPALRDICSSGAKTNCAAVLHSNKSKIAGISWSTIGLSYFAGSLITMLTLGITNPETLFILGWFSILALPYVFFSIYYQWKVARQWCVLCLTAQLILVLQFSTSMVGDWYMVLPLEVLTAKSILTALLAFNLPFIIINLLIPAYQRAKQGKQSKTDLQRLKHNPQIFDALLRKQKPITESTDGLGILLGNPDASRKIIKVCNPYCGPCAKAHPLIEELLQNSPSLQLQIIFTASNDEKDLKSHPVKHLLAIAEKGDEGLLRNALDDWYNAPEKDYPAFAQKYSMNGELIKQGVKVEAMRNWCDKMKIRATPTFFIDGHQLPEMYSVADLKYFFSV